MGNFYNHGHATKKKPFIYVLLWWVYLAYLHYKFFRVDIFQWDLKGKRRQNQNQDISSEVQGKSLIWLVSNGINFQKAISFFQPQINSYKNCKIQESNGLALTEEVNIP